MNSDVKDLCRELLDQVSDYYVTDDMEPLELIFSSMLSGSHVLFEDNPGLGKTLLVKTFAGLIGSSWDRVQFTPDLMPADVCGTRIWNTRDSKFELQKGPIFTNVLLADEINRAMPKTQSALLEVMEERQVTIEGNTLPIDRPFIVLATQNPIESEGTYPLPEAQLDRFGIKLSLGYLESEDQEQRILERRIEWSQDDPTDSLPTVMPFDDFRTLQNATEDIHVDESILSYITLLVRETREHPQLELGASPRGSLNLLKLSRARALVHGRGHVIPDDVQFVFKPVLNHRIVLAMEAKMDGIRESNVLDEVLQNIAVPRTVTNK